MAYSLLGNEIPISSVEDTNSTGNVSDLTEIHQMELLAQNFDNINMNNITIVRIQVE